MKYASTDSYHYIEKNENVECECGAQFKLVSGSWYDEALVEIIKSDN